MSFFKKSYKFILCFVALLLASHDVLAEAKACVAEKNWWPICNVSQPKSSSDIYDWLSIFQAENGLGPGNLEQKETLEIFKPSLERGFYLYQDAKLNCVGSLENESVRDCLIKGMKLAADAGSGDAAYEYFQLTQPMQESRKYLLLSAKQGSYAGRLIVGMELIENGKTKDERNIGVRYFESLALERKEIIRSLVKYKPILINIVPKDRILVWEILAELNKQKADVSTIDKITRQVDSWPTFCQGLIDLARGEQVESMPESNNSRKFAVQIVEITKKCAAK